VAPRISPRLSAYLGILGILGIVALVWIGSTGEAGYEILLPFVLLILAGARLSDRRWLPMNGALPVYLGEISYSIYMIHIFVIALFFDYLPKLGLEPPHWILISAAVIVGSSISYQLIEVPSRRFIYGLARNT